MQTDSRGLVIFSPTQVVRFKYETTPFPINSFVWAKVSGLPWWPGKFVAWEALPEETQEALADKHEAIDYEDGGAIRFFPSSKPTFAYLEKEKIVSYERGVELNYPSQKGKGAGIGFRDACFEAMEHAEHHCCD